MNFDTGFPWPDYENRPWVRIGGYNREYDASTAYELRSTVFTVAHPKFNVPIGAPGGTKDYMNNVRRTFGLLRVMMMCIWGHTHANVDACKCQSSCARVARLRCSTCRACWPERCLHCHRPAGCGAAAAGPPQHHARPEADWQQTCADLGCLHMQCFSIVCHACFSKLPQRSPSCAI